MKNKQLGYLFVCNFVIFFVGTGLLPVLPLYATQFGATPTVVGFYLAFTYVSIAVGTMLTGRLAERIMPKRLFLGVGTVSMPALVLLGQATALWQVVILTATVWFCAGIGLALISVFTGLFAANNSRGKSFSLMFLAFPLAAVTGGMSVGQLVAWQGYPLMFAVLGVVWAGWPLMGLLGLKNKPVAAPAPSAIVTSRVPLRLGQTFYLVLLVVLLSETALDLSRLGTSLSMQALNFSPSAVANTSAVGGLAMIPVTLLIGPLSDRLGRRYFLILGYLLAAGGALTLSSASQLWQFWLASVLLFAAMCVNGSVASALATDLLAPESLSRGLPWLNVMIWIAGIVGFGGAGYTMDILGAPGLYLTSATLSVLAAILLGLPPRKHQSVRQVRSKRRRHNLMPLHNKV